MDRLRPVALVLERRPRPYRHDRPWLDLGIRHGGLSSGLGQAGKRSGLVHQMQIELAAMSDFGGEADMVEIGRHVA
jgi:hypothetical protein